MWHLNYFGLEGAQITHAVYLHIMISHISKKKQLKQDNWWRPHGPHGPANFIYFWIDILPISTTLGGLEHIGLKKEEERLTV